MKSAVKGEALCARAAVAARPLTAPPPAPGSGHADGGRRRNLAKQQSFDIVGRVNRFFEWIGLKQKLHQSQHKPPFVSERDVWWASLGENIGSEVNGKSDRFSRPVVVIRKLAHGFYLVAPTTTKPREGTWYVHICLGDKDEYVCLNQIRTIDYRRLYSKLGQIDTDDFGWIREAFWRLYK